MNLYNKILNYLYNQNHMTIKSIYAEPIAQDLADIAREYHLIYMEELLKENIELKEQLDKLKKSLDERGIIT